jgi:hypothetical protein
MSEPKGTNVQAIEHSNKRGAFDYSALAPSTAEFLKAQVHRIRRQTAISIISIGKDLIAAKHYLSHGLFETWVEAEVGIPARTAQAYMQVARWSEHKTATVALLPPSVLYLLSSPRTPPDWIADILKRVELGECVTLPALRKELTRLRAEDNGQDAHATRAMQSKAQFERQDWLATTAQPAAALQRAVAILARGLSATDFAEVQQILTCAILLQDPALGRKIATAFAQWDAIEGQNDAVEGDPQDLHRTELAPRAENRFGPLTAGE